MHMYIAMGMDKGRSFFFVFSYPHICSFAIVIVCKLKVAENPKLL